MVVFQAWAQLQAILTDGCRGEGACQKGHSFPIAEEDHQIFQLYRRGARCSKAIRGLAFNISELVQAQVQRRRWSSSLLPDMPWPTRGMPAASTREKYASLLSRERRTQLRDGGGRDLQSHLPMEQQDNQNQLRSHCSSESGWPLFLKCKAYLFLEACWTVIICVKSSIKTQ